MPIITAAVIFATAASAQAPADRAVAGRYEYRDGELAGFLELRGDHTFEYKLEPTAQGEGPFRLFTTGVWRFDGAGRIALTNAPTAPPIFRQISAVRDPKVRAAITVVSTDGRPAEGLGLLTNDGENGQLNMLSDGGWTVPLTHAWDTDDGEKGTPTRLPRTWEIVRSSDDLSLVRIALAPDGPNHFTFSYTRSPIEPFHLTAQLVEGEPGAIEVEFGTASITMHKERPR